jgi:cytoskeletal protein CcmA (bactofilin family)
MWEKRDENPAPSAGQSGPAITQIGKSLKLEAEICGAEDLYIDGEVIGSIELGGKNLTIGPNGKVEADVVAQSVTIQGQLDGNVEAADIIELRKTGTFRGNVVSARILIEEGAVFRGSVDIVKPGQERAAKTEKKPAVRETGAPSRETKPAAKKSASL